MLTNNSYPTATDNGFKTYNNYGAYLRSKFNGKRVYKIIVDAGFTCPNRNGHKGRGGCSYCNVDSFTPEHTRSLPNIKQQIEEGMLRAKKNYRAEKFILYFQPNTNTYAPVYELQKIYDQALEYANEDVVGLSIGTRADCLDKEKILLLESYTKKLAVDLEIGMESIYNDTLLRINRGCLHEDFETIMSMLTKSPLHVCVHTVFGFPWETKAMMLAYAHEINRFEPIKSVKLHHLHIVEGSIMGVHYKREPFKLFSLDEYIDFLSELLPLLRPNLVIQRLFGISDLDKLIAPNWGLKKSEIQTYIDKSLEKRHVQQGTQYR